MPVGARYIIPETAPVTIQNLGDETFVVSTTRLTGEWTIRGSDLPPGYDLPPTAQAVLPFEQELELVIDLAAGTVSTSRTKAQVTITMSQVTINSSTVSGNAVCLPLNGSKCGQLVLDLEVQGVVSVPNDPSVVGQLRMEMLSSFYFDGSDVGLGHWTAMSANVTIGGNEGLISEFAVDIAGQPDIFPVK